MRKILHWKHIIASFCFLLLMSSPFIGNSQCNLLNENFNSPPVLAPTNTDGAWYPDRYRPSGFTNAVLGGNNVLKISIDGINDGLTNRPTGYGYSFYNTQGRKFNQCGGCVTVLKGDLWIPADWAHKHRRSDMWATAYDATNTISIYPIIGFRNPDGISPGIYYWNDLTSTWINSGINIVYNSWYHLQFRLAGNNVEYLVNGVVVATEPSNSSTYFGDIIMQAYNFNDPNLPAANRSTDSYSAYWDNLITTGTGGKVVRNLNTGETFCSIQGAIDDPQTLSGHIILAGPGTYYENVVINKEITLTGSGEGVTFIKPAISNPICGPFSLCGGSASNIILVQANNVTVQFLTADGDNPNLTSGITRGGADIDARNGIITNHLAGTFNNLNVNHVTIKNVYLRGVYASSGGTFNFNHNTVSNVQGSDASVAMFNFGGSGSFISNTVSAANDAISSNHSSGTTYSGNTVSNSGSGIHTDNNGDGGGTGDIISNNTVSNSTTGGYGIWVFVPYIAPTVNANTITNVDVALSNAGQGASVIPQFTNNTIDGQNKPGSQGVYQTTDQFGFGTQNVSGIYTNNFIKNTTTAFYLEYEAGNTNTINAHSNSITGNTNYVTNGTGPLGAGTLVNDFSCNWWGTYNGAVIAAKVSAGTNYTPWLTNSSDNSPAPGFQPAPNSCNGTPAIMCGDKNDKVIVCHKGHEICISPDAVQDHLNHGDHVGACTSGPNSIVLSANISNGKYIIPGNGEEDAPQQYQLSNYPNPFSNKSTIKYDLPFDSKVSIKIYNITGSAITTLVDGNKKAGTYTVDVNGAKLGHGMFYYKIIAQSKDKQFIQTNKMIVIQ